MARRREALRRWYQRRGAERYASRSAEEVARDRETQRIWRAQHREYQREWREDRVRRGVVLQPLTAPRRLSRWAARLRWDRLKAQVRAEVVREARADHLAWLEEVEAEAELW